MYVLIAWWCLFVWFLFIAFSMGCWVLVVIFVVMFVFYLGGCLDVLLLWLWCLFVCLGFGVVGFVVLLLCCLVGVVRFDGLGFVLWC